MTGEFHPTKAPVIDLFTGQILGSNDNERLIRISPEYDGVNMLYCNDANPEKIFKLPIMGWGLQHDGNVVGLVPWLNRVSACPTLNDPLNGHWEGYFNTTNGDVFHQAPNHKIAELQTAHHYHCQDSNTVIQEIPDQIGSHAAFTDAAHKTWQVKAIFSWQLYGDGHIEGMLIDSTKVNNTPVLMGDKALYSTDACSNFKYFFQYIIANKIRTKDPAAIKIISSLIKH